MENVKFMTKGRSLILLVKKTRVHTHSLLSNDSCYWTTCWSRAVNSQSLNAGTDIMNINELRCRLVNRPWVTSGQSALVLY